MTDPAMLEAILADRRLTMRDLRVLMALHAYADKSGKCHPTREQISDLTGYPASRISVITGRLTALGWIKKQGCGGKGVAAEYVVNDKPDTDTNSVTVTKSVTVTESVTQETTPADTGQTDTKSVTVTELATVTKTDSGSLSPPDPPNLYAPISPPISPPFPKAANGTRLPEWMPSETWAAFERHRKQKSKPVTPEARKRMFAKLGRLRDEGQDVTDVLEQSIENGWTGVFPVKVDRHESSQRHRKLSAAEQATADAERVREDIRRRQQERDGRGTTGGGNRSVEPDGSDLRPPLDVEFWETDGGGFDAADRHREDLGGRHSGVDPAAVEAWFQGDGGHGHGLATDAARVPAVVQSQVGCQSDLSGPERQRPGNPAIDGALPGRTARATTARRHAANPGGARSADARSSGVPDYWH